MRHLARLWLVWTLISLAIVGPWVGLRPRPTPKWLRPFVGSSIVRANASTNRKWFAGTSATTSATGFMAPDGGWENSATEANVFGIIPTAATAAKIDVLLSVDPGGAASWDVALRVDGVDSALTCNVAAGASPLACSLTTNVSLSQSQRVSIHSTANGGPTATRIDVVIEYTTTVADETIKMGNSRGNNVVTDTFGAFAGNGTMGGSAASGDAGIYIVMPFSATVTKFCARLATSTGAGGTRDWYVSKNNNNTSSTLTIHFPINSGTPTNSCDTNAAHNFSVVAGDLISMYSILTGAAASIGAWGVVILPNISGNFMASFASRTALATGTRFLPPSGYDGNSGTYPASAEAAGNLMMKSDVKLTGVYMQLQNAPGAAASGKAYKFDLHVNTIQPADNFEVTILETATTGSSSGSFIPADYDLLDTTAVGIGTPTTGTVAVSYSMTMNFTTPSNCISNAVFVDFSGATDTTTASQSNLNASTWGWTGNHWTAQADTTNPITFSSAAYKAPGYTVPTFCTNPWSGSNPNLTGLQITYSNTGIFGWRLSNIPAPSGTVQMGVYRYQHTFTSTPNIDTFIVHGLSTQFLNIPIINAGGITTIGFETPSGGSCTGHTSSSNAVTVAAGTPVIIAFYWTKTSNSVLATSMVRGVYDTNGQPINGAPGNVSAGVEQSCAAGANESVNYIQFGNAAAGALGETGKSSLFDDLLFYWTGTMPTFPPFTFAGGNNMLTMGVAQLFKPLIGERFKWKN